MTLDSGGHKHIPEPDPPKGLNGAEYEEHVATAILELKFWQGAKISRNRRFEGVRQRGTYEIDIAFEMILGEIAGFLMIVECKNHQRKVDRPKVQQLAQTRDAIGAHKAALVSPVGFTKEAIDVAKDLGVALWVIAVHDRYIDTASYLMMGPVGDLWRVAPLFNSLRGSLLSALGRGTSSRGDLSLVDANAAQSVRVDRQKWGYYRETAQYPGFCRWAVDEELLGRSAQAEIATAVLAAIRPDLPRVLNAVAPDWRASALGEIDAIADSIDGKPAGERRSPLRVERARALAAIEADDRQAFSRAFVEDRRDLSEALAERQHEAWLVRRQSGAE